MAAVWSNVKGVPPAPDCPCIALASCLARAAHGLTDPHVHAQTTSEFLRQPELSAPVGAGLLADAPRAAYFPFPACELANFDGRR